MTAASPHVTHEVLNQVPPLAGHDVADDPALLSAVSREGVPWAAAELHALGRLAGAPETQQRARLANEHPPVLRSHDARGNRIDEVEFHPAWHELMATAVRHGLHAAPWADPAAGQPRGAGGEVLCLGAGRGRSWLPGVDDLRGGARAPARAGPRRQVRAAACLPGVRTRACAMPAGKAGLLAGMAMTEKQGGSDVRANTTRAAAGRDRLPAHRAQMVLLGADVRSLPGPRPRRRRA